MDEEKNDISRQILLQIFYQHLIRQPAAATFCPCLGDADRVRLLESVNSPCLGDADRVRLLESVNSPCLGDADRVCFANRSIPHWGRLFLAAIYMH